jgi:serine/threonine protein kinase
MSNSGQSDPPTEFGPYTVHERLGVGGMAFVHRAVHRETGKVVALKRLLPQLAGDVALMRQFLRESEIAKAIAHPNIVGVHAYGEVGGERFLAMEYVRGQSILQLLRRANEDEQPAPVGVTVWILREILAALDYAMTGLDDDGQPFNIVHRDLSPSNIVLTPEGVVKLIDFGVAKSLVGRYATNSGRIKGKLGYMPPEVLAGRKVDQRSDLFSTAIVVWELLTAQRLFRGNEQEQLMSRARNHERTPPSSINRWVPKQLDRLLGIALEEDPEDRWASAGAMLDALQPILDSQGAGSSKQSVAQWCRQLRIAEGVFPDTSTNHTSPLAHLPPKAGLPKAAAPKVVMPTTQHNIPGVRRFVDGMHTVIDADFDASERHREVSRGERPDTDEEIIELSASDQTSPMEIPTPKDERGDFQDPGTDSESGSNQTQSWSPKPKQ